MKTEVVSSRTGLPVPVVQGVTLHSRYDPVAEGEAWAAAAAERLKTVVGAHGRAPLPSPVVLGLGFGYHVRPLVGMLDASGDGGGGRLAVWEPRREIIEAAEAAGVLDDIRPRIRLFAGRNPPADLLEETPAESILVHEPSSRLDPSLYDAYRGQFANRGRRIRVLVVGPLYGGTLEIAGYAARAFRSLGHEAEWMDFSKMAGPFHAVNDITQESAHRSKLHSLYAQFCAGAVVARAIDYKPDLVFALAQAPLIPEALDELRRHGIPAAFWFVEDFKHMAYWKGLVSRYDAVFPFQAGACIEEMETAGARNVHYLPAAADPEIHRPVALSPEDQQAFGSDVSFMGAAYYNRRRLLAGLIDFDFKIWGEGWPDAGPLAGAVQRNGARITAEDAIRIYNAAKVNVNLHSSAYHEGVNPVGDSVNPRTFEIAACGGFQLVDRRSLLPDLFGEDEMATFEDLEKLRDGARRYLADPDARAEVAERARARVLAEHTYAHRMAEMLGFLAARGILRARTEERGPERVEDLIREAGEGTDLQNYLARFRDRERISLDDIVSDIRKSGGSLSRTESLFLLLKELTP